MLLLTILLGFYSTQQPLLTDDEAAKAQKWIGLLWGGVGIAIAFVGFAFAIGYIINSFKGG